MATIIAEIGQNFVGDMELAKKLIELARGNSADLAKFQLYDSKKLYGEYQSTELTKEQAFMLFNYGKEIGIEVFFSVFDIERVKWCEEMGVRQYKVAFSMRGNQDLLEALYRTRKHIIISTNRIEKYVTGWSYLYCIPHYPTSLGELWFSLNPFDYYYDGFSDHTIGIDAAKIALARGAQIIEKHFAVDHKTGVDAEWSMTPDELRELKRFALVVEEAL